PPAPTPAMGWIIGSPVVTDADEDGTPDVVATVALASEHTAAGGVLVGGKGRRVLAAASGKDGHGLWIQAIDDQSHALNHADDRPAALFIRERDRRSVGVLSPLLASGSPPTEPATWRTFDLKTGTPLRAPIDVGFVPVRPVQLADLDGDGADELVALGPGGT